MYSSLWNINLRFTFLCASKPRRFIVNYRRLETYRNVEYQLSAHASLYPRKKRKISATSQEKLKIYIYKANRHNICHPAREISSAGTEKERENSAPWREVKEALSMRSKYCTSNTTSHTQRTFRNGWKTTMEDGLKLCLKIAAKIGYTQTQTQRHIHTHFMWRSSFRTSTTKRNCDNDLFPCCYRARSTERTESEVKQPTVCWHIRNKVPHKADGVVSSTSDQFPYLIVTPSANIILYCRRLNII